MAVRVADGTAVDVEGEHSRQELERRTRTAVEQPVQLRRPADVVPTRLDRHRRSTGGHRRVGVGDLEPHDGLGVADDDVLGCVVVAARVDVEIDDRTGIVRADTRGEGAARLLAGGARPGVPLGVLTCRRDRGTGRVRAAHRGATPGDDARVETQPGSAVMDEARHQRAERGGRRDVTLVPVQPDEPDLVLGVAAVAHSAAGAVEVHGEIVRGLGGGVTEGDRVEEPWRLDRARVLDVRTWTGPHLRDGGLDRTVGGSELSRGALLVRGGTQRREGEAEQRADHHAGERDDGQHGDEREPALLVGAGGATTGDRPATPDRRARHLTTSPGPPAAGAAGVFTSIHGDASRWPFTSTE